MLYNIYAGLGGGFGGATYVGTLDCKDAENPTLMATNYAYELACEEYDSYGGLHGLLDPDDVRRYPEDYGFEEYESITDEDIEDLILEDREFWVDYYCVAADKDVNIDKSERIMLV